MYIRFGLFAPFFFSSVFFYVITFLFLCLFPFSPCLPSLLLFVICLTFSFPLFFFFFLLLLMWWNSLKPQFYVLDGEYGPVKERAFTHTHKKGHAAKLCRQTYIFSMKSLSFVCS